MMNRVISSLKWVLVLALALPAGLGLPQARAAESSIPPETAGWVEISSAEQLLYVNDNQEQYLTRNIRLLNDIELPSGSGWQPLGGNGAADYSGIFDGGGHRVAGIYVSEEEAGGLRHAGFFGRVSGTIVHLGVAVDISGGINTGGLAGEVSGGRIERSYSIGTVAGGLNKGDVAVAGGLVGASNNSSISSSYSAASVTSGTANNRYAGGLIGSQGSGEVRDVYARGSVTSLPGSGHFQFAAGLSAFIIYGSVERAYATGHVDSAGAEGAMYAALGGLNASKGTVGGFSDSYYDADSTGMTTDASDSVGLGTAAMRDSESYTGWDFERTWAIHPDINGGYPYLRHEILDSALPPATKDIPYERMLGAFAGADVALSWSATSLPPGMTLDADGLLRGTPEQSGDYLVELTALDAGGVGASKTLELVVGEYAPEPLSFSVTPGVHYGTTRAHALPASEENVFYYALGDALTGLPLIGDDVPEEAIAYAIGSDIPSAVAGRYLTVYEADAAGLIQTWRQLALTTEHIQTSVGSVSGSVYGIGDAPLSGATVTIGETAATTDEEGIFSFPIIEMGARTLKISAEGYVAKDVLVDIAAGAHLDVGTIGLSPVVPDEETPSTPPPYHGPTEPTVPRTPVKLNGMQAEIPVRREINTDGRTILRLIADAELTKKLLENGGIAVIEVNNAEPIVKLDLQASELTNARVRHPDGALELRIKGASYRIPHRYWSSLPAAGIITIAIAEATADVRAEVEALLSSQGLTMEAVPVDFAIYVDGQESARQGSSYLVRSIRLETRLSPDEMTVVWLDANGKPQFIPSVFREAEEGGGIAEFYAPHNSLYTVVRSKRTFSDIRGHWARNDIELLARKLIVSGDDPNYRPEDKVTRAEFAALLVRSLGIAEAEARSSASFSDVGSKDWYASAAQAAAAAGLVTGYEDGTFRPDNNMTREEMAVMLDRAMAYAGSRPQPDSSLSQHLKDIDNVSIWAKEAAQRLTAASIIQGDEDGRLAPRATATRAQCAALLKRMLKSISFI